MAQNPCDSIDQQLSGLVNLGDNLASQMEEGLSGLTNIGLDANTGIFAEMSAVSANIVADFESTKLPNIQDEINKALSKTGLELGKAVKQIEEDFSVALKEAGEDLSSILEGVGLPKPEDLPTLDKINSAINQGFSDLGSALAAGGAEINKALGFNLNQLTKKLDAIEVPSLEQVCANIPNYDVNSEGKAIKIPKMPELGKAVPLPVAFKGFPGAKDTNPTKSSIRFFSSAIADETKEIKEKYITYERNPVKSGNTVTGIRDVKSFKVPGNTAAGFNTVTSKGRAVLTPEGKLRIQSETYFLYEKLAGQLNVNIKDVRGASKAIKITKEKATATGVDQNKMFNNVKIRYNTSSRIFGVSVTFDDAVKNWQNEGAVISPSPPTLTVA